MQHASERVDPKQNQLTTGDNTTSKEWERMRVEDTEALRTIL